MIARRARTFSESVNARSINCSRSADRYATDADLAREVERFLADERVEAHREPLITRAARWARRHRVAVAAALVLGTGGAGLRAGGRAP